LFGGGLRVRGFAGDQMGLTINGAPVNDSGNFAVYPQEYTDSENLCEVFVTQGSTDTDAPHVGASGGNLGMVTCSPKDKFGMRTAVSKGQLNYQRAFVRVDTGKFGPSDAKAFVSYSKTSADKFKGPGEANREHIDFAAEVRPSADVFLSASLLYNKAVNNNIRAINNAQIAQYGTGFDFSSVIPQHLTPLAGTAQLESSPADAYYQCNINPFRNYLFTSKAEFKVNKDLTLSAEPYFWYGYGTGGGFEMQLLNRGGGALSDAQFFETAQRLIGNANASGLFDRVFTQFSPEAPQLQILVDRDRMAALGVDFQSAMQAFSFNIGSFYVNDTFEGGRVRRVFSRRKSSSSTEVV
jgi:iron complex outermembrane receptor protein